MLRISFRILLLGAALLPVAGFAMPPAQPLPGGGQRYVSDPATIELNEEGHLRMTVTQSKNWLTVNLPSLLRDITKTKDGVYFVTDLGPSRMIVSGTLKSVPAAHNSKDCFDAWWTPDAKAPMPRKNVVTQAKADMWVASYQVEIGGPETLQGNMNVYAYKDGYCADVHISRMGYRPTKDAPYFTNILDTIGFQPK